jgi:DNA-binding MarR family transcriptional regulator
MGLTRQSVQQTADALEEEGFVEYLENPHHRRARLVAMTPKGRKALRHVEERQADWANRISAAVDVRRLRGAVSALREAREQLERDTQSLQVETD